MKLTEKTKKIIITIAVIVFIILAVIWFFNSNIKHIEDTNGADNYTLQTITDENIIKKDIGALGLKESKDFLGDTVTYSSKKYTGVSELYGENIITNLLTFNIIQASVQEGNFKIALVVNDKIVHEFALNELLQTYNLENVSGRVALVIAGESANFKLDFRVE